MKKLISLTLALMLALSSFALSAMAESPQTEKVAAGVLSLLNIGEEEYAAALNANGDRIAEAIPALEGEGDRPGEISSVVYYDTLDAMLMGLQAGDVNIIILPMATADYVCARNDNLFVLGDVKQLELTLDTERELRNSVTGFSFLMLDTNADLRDEFDAAIADMKDDGTLGELVKTYIVEAVDDEEQEIVAFDNEYEETVRVAVTGVLPPIDYVAPDGTYAGYNTAVLAEIGKRIGKNIELVQTDSMGRAAALASGTADAVFWTRVSIAPDAPLPGESEELHAQHIKELDDRRKSNTGEDDLPPLPEPGQGGPGPGRKIDMPEGTIVTDPYYADYIAIVAMKDQ